MATPPPLSAEAREAALAKAAEARRVRAELKGELKDGVITFSDVLERAETDELVAKTKVLTLIEALPGVGKVKARRTMERIGIAESRRIQGLGENQRHALLAAFGRDGDAFSFDE
ncbi:MAG: integration host factor, actinobacterial type [Actinomycetota bacterium]